MRFIPISMEPCIPVPPWWTGITLPVFKSAVKRRLYPIFTAAGSPFTQGIAFSNDRGRTWTKFDNNPVLGHIVGENRDPKVIWYAPEKKWIMALYLDHT